jgi:hypothetical protein
MDCKSARVLLSFDRPWASELDADEAQALRLHLAACPACTEQVQQDHLSEERLASAVRAVPLPEGLHGRLLGRLAREQSVLMRRRMLRIAAAAAAVLLAVGVGWYVRLSLRPGVDAEEIVRIVDLQPSHSPEKVQEWFQERYGLPAPIQFNNSPINYGLMMWHGRGEFLGVKGVPQLLFIHHGENAAFAFIYVLSDSSFDVNDATLPTRAAGSFYRAEVFRDPANPRVAYVILYTGDSLAPFLLRPRPDA